LVPDIKKLPPSVLSGLNGVKLPLKNNSGMIREIPSTLSSRPPQRAPQRAPQRSPQRPPQRAPQRAPQRTSPMKSPLRGRPLGGARSAMVGGGMQRKR